MAICWMRRPASLFIDAAGYPDRPDNGTPTLVARRQGLDSVDLRLASLTGNFDLLQVDLAELFNPGAGNPLFTALSIDVTGLLDGGGSVQRQITLDGISDGPGGVADFETFVFDASWTNLTQVVFHGVRPGSTLPHIKIDNIEVQAAVVPEPSTAMLVLLGLMGLGASRRDRMGVDGAPSRVVLELSGRRREATRSRRGLWGYGCWEMETKMKRWKRSWVGLTLVGLVVGCAPRASGVGRAVEAAVDASWQGASSARSPSVSTTRVRNREGLQAPNRAQGFRTYFDETGIRMVERGGSEGAELARLSLAAVGRGDRLEPVGSGEVVPKGRGWRSVGPGSSSGT
ncbi:MAG: PEP-CTERM sorting domain-containing protein [Myxococcota bacterium]